MKKPLLFSLLDKPIAYLNLQNSFSNQLDSFTVKMRNISLLLTMLIALCFTTSSSYGQAADAINAVQICDGIWPQPAATANFGVQELNAGNRGCLASNEVGSNWYWVKVTTSGNMAFSVQGLKSNGAAADIDGAVWGPFASVAAGSSAIAGGTDPIRCSYAVSTGMELRNGNLQTSEGQAGDGIVGSIPVTIGQYYLILVDNFDANNANGARSISWSFTSGNSAQYECPAPPVLPAATCASANGPSNDLGVKTARGVQPSGTFTFTQCNNFSGVPFKSGDGTFTQCYTVNSGANGNIGAVQQILIYGTGAGGVPDCLPAIAGSRTATLSLKQPPPCAASIPANVLNAGNSSTFNPEWTGLTPNTDYILCIETTMPAPSPGVICNYRQSCVDIYHWTTPAATFAFNCGTASLSGTFTANGTTGQTGNLTVPITSATAGNATFNVTSVVSGITGTLSTLLTAGQTSVVIPVTFNGSGAAGSRTISVTSAQTSSTCSKVFTVGGCTAGTTAPTLSATTKSNVCPATTADVSSLVSSTCPVGSSLEWHNTNTGLSATTLVTATSLGAGTYYPVCHDATAACYSPTPSTGVTVSITVCVGPLDSDNDGILDSVDLDDDNDGILDSVECVPTNLITNGDFANAGTGWTSSFFPTPVTGPLVYPTGTMRILVDNDGNLYPNRVLLANNTSLNMVSGKTYNFSAEIGIYPGSTSQTSDFGFVLIDATGNIVQTIETFKSRAVGVGNVLINGTVTNYPKSFVSTVTGNYRLAMTWKGGGLGAADDISFDNIIISTICDTDGDGIANNLDLDSDGDGCSDAIEGGGSFTPTNLVASSMAGGNSGVGYTGTSAIPVVSNLGNTVNTTVSSASYGVPTIATTGQGLGDSQNGAVSSQCTTCNATVAPTLSATTATNICPSTIAFLNLITASNLPSGTTLSWHVGTPATAANEISPGVLGFAATYYAAFKGLNGAIVCFGPTTPVTVTETTCAGPLAITQPAVITKPVSTPVTGTAPTDLIPTGGTGAINYSNGSTDALCVQPIGATALPATSNLLINSLTGAYSYTTPTTAGTYYFCVKVCDSASPTPSCAFATYKVVVTPPACAAGTVAPGVN
jgi:hypothetical protein